MEIIGKGFYIWQIDQCENGQIDAIANVAYQSGLSYVMIKIANGMLAYNYDDVKKADLAGPLVAALHTKGIKAWGWHYVYGYNPEGEAKIAINRIQETGVDGFIINAEGPYKESGSGAALRYMKALRASINNIPLALSSYRYPSLHPQLPWVEFLDRVDYNMPQVYWVDSHNPGAQLERCVKEFKALNPYRAIIPSGAAYKWSGWTPTQQDEIEFMNMALTLNIPSVNFWDWQHCRRDLPQHWEVIKSFPWPTGPLPAPADITERYIAALNTHDVNKVIALYDAASVHVTSERTIQGTNSLKAWYTDLFQNRLPNAVFTLTGALISGNSRHFNWTATSTKGKVTNGNDTIGLISDKIGYHYSFYTITTA